MSIFCSELNLDPDRLVATFGDYHLTWKTRYALRVMVGKKVHSWRNKLIEESGSCRTALRRLDNVLLLIIDGLWLLGWTDHIRHRSN